MDTTTDELKELLAQSLTTAFDTRDAQLADLRTQLSNALSDKAALAESINGIGGLKQQNENLRAAMSTEEADFATKIAEKQTALDAALTDKSIALDAQRIAFDASINDMQAQRDVALDKLARAHAITE